MIFDSHAHLDSDAFDGQRDQLIRGLREEGILVLNPGCDRPSSDIAVELANNYDNVYAAVGTHPHEALGLSQEDLMHYEDLTKDPRVLAIGEIGLDFHYDFSPRDIQEEAFRSQLYLAQRVDLPVLVHMREATEETLYVLRDNRENRGVIHCYSEGWQEAKDFLDLGYYIALGGMVTFKNAEKTREVAKNIPLDRLLIETDSPYLAPHPHRGRTNQPSYVRLVAEKIGDLRYMSPDEIIEITEKNAKEMLGL